MTLIVLSAVVVGGGALFGSEVLAVWKSPGNAEQALAAGDAFEGLLAFDAPDALSSRYKTLTAEAEQGIRKGPSASLLARNWRFTQSPSIDALILSLNLYMSALQAEIALANFNNFIEQLQTGLAGNTSPFATFLSNALESFQGAVNTALVTFVNTAAAIQKAISPLIPPAFQPPPIPPASPCTC